MNTLQPGRWAHDVFSRIEYDSARMKEGATYVLALSHSIGILSGRVKSRMGQLLNNLSPFGSLMRQLNHSLELYGSALLWAVPGDAATSGLRVLPLGDTIHTIDRIHPVGVYRTDLPSWESTIPADQVHRILLDYHQPLDQPVTEEGQERILGNRCEYIGQELTKFLAAQYCEDIKIKVFLAPRKEG